MEKVSKRKNIFYKRAEIQNSKNTLQYYISEALTQCNKPLSRSESLNNDNTIYRLINSYREQNGMIFGQMLRYEAGKDQAILKLDDDSDEYPIETIGVSSSDDGKKREFLESVLYFGIVDNHVVVLQSQALKARDLEYHLMWLLHSHSKVLPVKCALCLSDHPSKEARKKIENMPVKKVSIGAPLEAEESSTENEQSEKTISFKPFGKGFDILTAFLGKDWRNGLKLDDSLDEANLRVSLEVSYVRSTTKKAHKTLDTIARAMRHAEPEDVKVHLDGGGFLQGSELKFSGIVNVMTYNGIVDSEDLYIEMHTWFRARIKEGNIT